MTNAEVYIGDEDLIDQFIDEFSEFAYSEDIDFKYHYLKETLVKFFKQERKPPLTEDERVILRNFRERYKYIGREGMLYIAEQERNSNFVSQVVIDEYKSDLFQFIKNGEEYEIAELLKGE